MIDPGPLSAATAIGIDVVDCRNPRVMQGLPKDRTVDRVLSDTEAARLAASADPVRDFWLHWGAKEAAFKATTLLRGAPPVFAHAAFEVDLARERVQYGEIELALAVHTSPERLVVVARSVEAEMPPTWAAGTVQALHRGAGGADLAALRDERFSPAERDAVRGLPSALVRMAVRREAAHCLEVDEARLQVICPAGPTGRRPPYLHLDGVPTEGCGISISHDGDWLAWGVSVSGSAAGS